jgi:hypothetical protein
LAASWSSRTSSDCRWRCDQSRKTNEKKNEESDWRWEGTDEVLLPLEDVILAILADLDRADLPDNLVDASLPRRRVGERFLVQGKGQGMVARRQASLDRLGNLDPGPVDRALPVVRDRPRHDLVIELDEHPVSETARQSAMRAKTVLDLGPTTADALVGARQAGDW